MYDGNKRLLNMSVVSLIVLVALGVIFCSRVNAVAQVYNVTTLAGNGTAGYVDGTAGASQFNSPTGVFVDNTGSVFVSDWLNNYIRKISPSAVVTTLAGSGFPGYADGFGTSVRFQYPNGIVVDSHGNIFIADRMNQLIRKINPLGEVTTFAGTYGVPGFANGVGTSARFNRPSALAIDQFDNIYVTDFNNHRIRRITPSGNVTTVAGSGSAGYANGSALSARFNSPTGVAIDYQGNIYVSDYNHAIRKISLDGVVSTIAGTNAPGYADGNGTNARFNFPHHIVVDNSGNLYVTDVSNHRIRKITSSGVVSTIAGSVPGFSDGNGNLARFNSPYGIALDALGNIYIGDLGNHRIRKLTPSSVMNYSAAWSGTVFPEGVTNVGEISATQTISLTSTEWTPAIAIGEALTPNVHYSVANVPTGLTLVVTKISATQVRISFTGNSEQHQASNNLSNVQVVFLDEALNGVPAVGVTGLNGVNLSMVFLDSSTAVYSDTTFAEVMPANAGAVATVRTITLTNAMWSDSVMNNSAFTVNSHYTVANVPDGLTIKVTKISSSQATISFIGVAARHQAVNSLNNIQLTFLDAALNNIAAIDVMGLNGVNLSIAFSGQACNTVTTFAGDGSSGSVDGVGTAASFADPIGIATDRHGNVYVGDGAKIRKITPSGVVSTLAGANGEIDGAINGLAVDVNGNVFAITWTSIYKVTPSGTVSAIPTPGYEFVNGSDIAVDAFGNLYASVNATSILKISPNGVIAQVNNTPVLASSIDVDRLGNVYCGGYADQKVYKVAPNGDVVTIAGTGVAGYNDGLGTVAQFNEPVGITLDANGNLYVMDYVGSYIRKITPGGMVSTIAGSGVTGYLDGPGPDAQFNYPIRIALDTAGNLFLTDRLNYRIRSINVCGAEGALLGAAKYSDTVFTESLANNGSTGTSQTITLGGVTWADAVAFGTAFTLGTHFTAANVPAGLIPVVTKTSSTQAIITFTGAAVNHQSANTVTNVRLTFSNAALSGMAASAVQGLNTVNLSVVFRNADTASYSGTTFPEATANNGTILTTRTVTLTSAQWTNAIANGAAFTAGTHFTAANVPSGLTLTVTKVSSTVARLAFSGAALAHENINDASLTLTFLNAALANGNVSGVIGLTPKTLTIDFNDAPVQQPLAASYSRTIFTESASNIGVLSVVASTATISITGATFLPTGTLVAGTDYTATGVPAGLTLVLNRTSPTTVALSFTGAATAHAVANNATFALTFLNAAVSNGNAAAVTGLNRTLSVQFLDPYTAVYSGLVFDESVKNDGSITTKQTITLAGTSFVYWPSQTYPVTLASSGFWQQYSAPLVPNGLTMVIVATSPTTAEISFTGKASAHASANNTSFTVNFLNRAVTSGNVSGVQGLTPVTLSLHYRNPYTASYSGTTFLEAPANNGTITQTETVTLSGDTFVAGTLVSGTHFTATGVPAGLALVLTRTSDTTAQIAFTGTATAHENINDASVVLTFLNAALVNSTTASSIAGLTPKTLTIDFANVPPPGASAAYSDTTFTEVLTNNGQVTVTQTVTLSGAAFVTGAYANGTHFVPTGVPSGLTLTVTRLSATQARIAFTGTATAHALANSANVSLTFLPAIVAGGNVAGVVGLSPKTLRVNFIDPYTASYSDSTFVETITNDGTVSTVRTVSLVGTTFTPSATEFVAGTHFNVAGVPAGLTLTVTKISPSVAQIAFTGAALAHINDVTNIRLTFLNAAIATGNAAGVLGLTPKTLSIDFIAPYTATYSAKNFIEGPTNDGSVPTTRLISLFGGDSWLPVGTFTNGTHFTATGVPAGLTLVVTRTSSTGAQISFTGTAAAHANINDASVTLTFLNAALASGNAAAVTGLTPATLAIDFRDIDLPAPASPNILGFTPQVGTTGTVVTISGFGFTGAQNVLFGGTPASSFTVVSDSVVTAVVENGSTGDVTLVTANGLGILPGFTFVPRPTISSFTPTTGNQGQVVTINGANFRGTALNGTNWTTTSVYFGGTPATSFTVISATQIQATVGAGATGAVRVETLPGNVGVRNGFCYMAPLITAFAPVSASTGTQVVITGSNFTGATAVRFNGRAAASYTVVSDTEIRAFPAANTPLTGSISVTTPQCTDDLATFTFIPAPVIYGFWLSGGTNGDVITIDGINFDNASAVKFGDTVAASYTVVSPTRITAVVGNGKTGAVSVTGPGGVGTRSKFIYYAPGAGRPNPPVITSFSPTEGPDGAVVTINGLNFQGTDWFTTAVRIGDAPDGPRTAIIQSMTATRLVVRVNGGATGLIRVYTPAGVTTSTQTFTYFPPPSISAFSPTTGGAGTVVTVLGTNFNGVTSVRIGNTAVSSYTVDSPTQITATVGAGTTGRVTVVANGGTATSSTNFTFPTPPPAPTLTSFTQALATTGTVVTSNGSNFTGATQVSFGGTPAQSFTVVNAGRITAVLGAGASGSVAVTTPSGSASKAGFTYLPKPLPTITSFSPASASAGQTVTILGTYFTGATQVFMGSASVPFTVVNSGRITVEVPSNAASGVIRVVTPNGVALRPGFTFITTLLAFDRFSSLTSQEGFGAGLVIAENQASQELMSLGIFPNPVSESATLTATGFAEGRTVNIVLLNALGQVVMRLTQQPVGGAVQARMDVHSLPSGAYTAVLSDGQARQTLRFVKQ